jgi:hypothetical protein
VSETQNGWEEVESKRMGSGWSGEGIERENNRKEM